jgi:F-type H+-transporting ATPase subunit epsilon
VRLLITDPTEVVADHPDVVSLCAEDESGGFGILTGHADLLTVLPVSVVSWRHADGKMGYCAVRRGVLTVQGGKTIAIATTWTCWKPRSWCSTERRPRQNARGGSRR